MTEAPTNEPAVEEAPKEEDATPKPANDLQAVIKELERLLSKENLASDPQISSALNPQLCVPVNVIASCPSMLELCDSEEILLQAAEQSQTVGLTDDKTMMRALLKSKRNTLIMRELAGVEEADIRTILTGSPGEAEIVSIRAEVNDTWFVEFVSEEMTQETALWLRSKQHNGSPIKVAIKSEHFLRSFFPAQQAVAPVGKGMVPAYAPGMPFFPMAGKGKRAPMYPPWMMQMAAAGKGMPGMKGMGLAGFQAAAAAAQAAYMVAEQERLAQSPEGRASAGASLLELLGGGRKEKSGKKKKMAPKVEVANASQDHSRVPPSPPKPAKDAVFAQMYEILGIQKQELPAAPEMPQPVETEAPMQVGYTSEFRHYGRDEIKAICAKVTTFEKPEAYDLMAKLNFGLGTPDGKFEEKQNWDVASPPPKKKPAKKEKAKPKEKPKDGEKDKSWKLWFEPKKGEYTAEEWATWEEQEKKKKKPKAKAKAAEAPASKAKETTMKWVAKA
jgi:hypothetical protein